MANTNPTDCPFDAPQIRKFVKDAIKRTGGKEAWAFVGPEVRKLAIEAACFRAFANLVPMEKMDSNWGVKPSEMQTLRQAMMTEAGIDF